MVGRVDNRCEAIRGSVYSGQIEAKSWLAYEALPMLLDTQTRTGEFISPRGNWNSSYLRSLLGIGSAASS